MHLVQHRLLSFPAPHLGCVLHICVCTLQYCSLCCLSRCKPHHQNAEAEDVSDRVRWVEAKNKPSHQNFFLLVTDSTIYFCCVPPFPPHACVAPQLFTGSLTRFCFRCQEACSLFKNLRTHSQMCCCRKTFF